MVHSISSLLLYLTCSFGFVLCQGKSYPEYEQYYEGMNEKQRQAFKYFVRSYRKYNDTMSHFPKDKLAKMDEYLDTSGRGTMMDNVLYDNLKDKYDRDKAMQKYSHPDDQEMYMAVRKYTPTLASSEISNWIHNINSRYRNILGINETSAPSVKTQISTTIKSTKFSTRFTIFKKGVDPFASSDEYYDSSDREKLTKTYPKRKIEPIQSPVEKQYILSSKVPRVLHNASKEMKLDQENPVELMVKEYFKSQSIKYQNNKNAFGFQTCPTGSPLSQEKLMKEFEEMMKVPDMRVEQIFRNYENRSVYNSSYIEDYIRANNLSTIWVSDLPILHNSTRAEKLETDNDTSSGFSQHKIESSHAFTKEIRSSATQKTTEDTPLDKPEVNENILQIIPTRITDLLEDNTTIDKSRDEPVESEKIQQMKPTRNDLLEDNIEDPEEDQKKLESSFKTFLMGNSKKGNYSLRELFDNFYDDEKHLETDSLVTTEDPSFNSSYYKYIENKFDELEKKVTFSNLNHAAHQEETTDYEFTYNQERMFDKEVFQNTEELVGPRVVDRLDPSLEKKFRVDEQKDEQKVPTIQIEKLKSQILKNMADEKLITPKIVKQEITHDEPSGKSTGVSRSCGLNITVVRENQKTIAPLGGCETCSNLTVRQHKHRRRHHKHHRSHRRRHFHGYRGPQYPPNPYAYNPYHPPPYPYPYPPEYHPPPQPPNYYHFTSLTSNDNQPNQMPMRTTDDQFELYMKLKDIFQPVDKLLIDIASSTQASVSLRKRWTPRTRTMFTMPNLPTKGGTVDSEELQKYLEKRFELPPAPPVNSSTDHPARIRAEKYLPKGIYEDQRYFYTNTRSILDHHPDYPDLPTTARRTQGDYGGPSTSPRIHRSYQRRHRGRHRHCCCHHHQRRNKRYRGRNPKRRYHAGGIIEERLIDSRDVPPEYREEGVTGYKSFAYTSFETMYRGVKYGSEKPPSTCYNC